MCPKCSSVNIISADISNSCLIVKCNDENCGSCSSLPVRPSALSLFGLAQLLLTIIGGVLGFTLACKLGYRPMFRTVTVFVCVIIGSVFARFFVRSIAIFLLDHGVSPIWKKEIVSYLASPFSKQEKDK